MPSSALRARPWPGALAGLLLLLAAAGGQAVEAPAWQPWSPEVLIQARREGRLILIELAAEWCAACQRMDALGFRDPRVLETLGRRYIPVRVDIDREPQMQRRFADLGVPALAILDGEGTEVLRRRGYLEPDWLYWLLLAVADNPDPQAHR